MRTRYQAAAGAVVGSLVVGVLIIGPTEAKAIRTAIEGALQNPIPWEALRPIADNTGRAHLPLDQRACPASRPRAANIRRSG